jgi:uncharacterized protein (TIGR02611 family)
MIRIARKLGTQVVGWVLVAAGIAALVLPGPGLLMLFLGVLILSSQYSWAERHVETVKRRAFDAAEQGVRTWPRIVLSALSACALIAVGVWVSTDPRIPTFGPVGPQLPFAGLGTGVTLAVSGLVALVLVGYSVRRFR